MKSGCRTPLRACRTALASLALLTAQATAGELADFHTAVEGAMRHNRVTIGYLRTGNIDLAAVELGELRKAWQQVAERFGTKRPDAFSDGPLYVTIMTDVTTRIVTATILADSGRADGARSSLEGVRATLSKLRRDSGLYVLADCVLDVNAIMAPVLAYRKAPPDLTKSTADLIGKSAIAAYEVKRCDAMAPAAIKRDPEFRRLVDGATASLAHITDAIETRDGGLLIRLLDELSAFDNLLAFRYG